MSLCILPYNDENIVKLDKISRLILSEGKFIKITTNELVKNEHDKILEMYRKERDKQYDEIVEECQEFIDETYLIIKNNKFTKKKWKKWRKFSMGYIDGLTKLYL